MNLDILELSAEQRQAAEAALLLPEEPAVDESGNIRPMHALAVILRQVPGMAAEYARLGIPETVLRDTLSDLRIWMNTCKRLTGEWGLREYTWLTEHVNLRLFRLGRLQFAPGKCAVPAVVYAKDDGEVITLARDGDRFTRSGEADGANGLHDPQAWTATLDEDEQTITGFRIAPEGLAVQLPVTLQRDAWACVLRPGDPVLDVHIPEGEPLRPEAVRDAFAQAPAFFARHWPDADRPRAFVCESWLLDWALQAIAPDSNVARFQKLFYCVPFAGSDKQTMERVFDFGMTAPVLSENSSRLQRAVYDWYGQGNRCRDAYGYIPIDAGGNACFHEDE